VTGRLAVTAGVTVVGALLTTASAPIGALGLAPHQLRWLWPVGALVLLALLVALVRRVIDTTAPAPVPVVGALTVVVAGLCAANLPTFNQGAGPSADARAIPVVAALDRQLGVLEGGGPVLIDLAGIRFAEPYTLAVMAELQRRGVEFVVPEDDEVMVRQLGPSRRFDGTNAERLVLVREGESARTEPPGTRRVAIVEALDPGELSELAELRTRVIEHLTREPLRLSPAGAAAVAAGTVPGPDGLDPAGLLATRLLLDYHERGLLEVDGALEPDLDRLTALQRRDDRETVAVFVGPLSARPSRQGSS
jgi:hypothetical protein